MTLRVLTWNMNHRKKVKRQAWDLLRHELAADIALVQEAHPPDDLLAGEQFVYPRPEQMRGNIGASGIWSRGLPIRRVDINTTLPEALAVAAITLPNWTAQLIAISMYGTFDKTSHVTPNLHRMISDLHPVFMDKASRGRVILGGDWNIDPKYNKNYPRSSPLHKLVFDRLEDPFYALQKCNEKPLVTMIRGSYQDDYIFAGNRLISKLISCEAIEGPEIQKLSDHLPVLAVFEL